MDSIVVLFDCIKCCAAHNKERGIFWGGVDECIHLKLTFLMITLIHGTAEESKVDLQIYEDVFCSVFMC
jgi:hypothetical protein